MQLNQFPMVFKQTVAWGDMDAFAHVNNVQYYRYIESARIAYFSQFGLFSEQFYTVVASSQCRYLSPVLYPDTLLVYARVEELRNSAMRMLYILYSEQQQKIVAEGEAVMVCLDQITHQKTALPERIKQRIVECENAVGHMI